MPYERATGNQQLQIGREAQNAPGVPVPCTRLLKSIDLTLNPAGNMQDFRPQGSRLATVVYPGQEWSAGALSGRPVYDELMYAFDMIVGNRVDSVTGTTGQAHDFTLNASGSSNYGTYTAEKGDAVRAGRAAGLQATGLSLTINRNEFSLGGAVMGGLYTPGVQMSTNEVQTVTIAGAPTGGTFTLSFGGQTTTGIAYNASAAAVQTALEALSTIGVGNVVVTGGPGPGTPWAVEFRGTLRQTDVAAMTATGSLTGGSTPTVAVAATTPGVAPTALPQIPIQPNTIDLFLDNTAAALGTTKYLRGFAASLGLGDVFAAGWPINSALPSYGFMIENAAPSATMSLTVEADATGEALLTDLRAGNTKFMRIQATGPVIGGGPATYLLRMDAAVKFAEFVGFDDLNGIVALPWPLRIVNDAWGALKIRLINATASL